tara:strand:+ start:1135 stop:1860 length:726 start_codon:yes stop_codon:yes gene_type:complete
MNDYILIIGAKSDIARELAKVYAMNGYNLILAGRSIKKLKNFKEDLEKYHIDIILKELDITDYDFFPEFISSLLPFPKGFIFVVGSNPINITEDIDQCLNTIHVNYIGPVLMINHISNSHKIFKDGFIIGISSVAGERGRQKNYIYGSAKSAFSTYLSGLRQKLNHSGIHVMTVHPGFVKTNMTKDIPTIKFLTANPSEVAHDIYNAQQNKKDILYTKWYWKYIMFIIRNIPEFIFKKTNI